jgi:hypothetical protein
MGITVRKQSIETDLCARHYWRRVGEMPSEESVVGLRKPAATVGVKHSRRAVRFYFE